MTVGVENGTALTAWDGKLGEAWSVDTFDTEYVQTVNISDGTAILASEHSVGAISLDEQRLLWTRDFAVGQRVSAPAASTHGVFVPVGRSLVALDLATGNEMWRRNFESAPVTPLISEGFVVTGASRPSHGDQAGPLRAMDPDTGSVVWEAEPPGDRSFRPHSPIRLGAIILDKQVKLGGGATLLIGVDPSSGKATWNKRFTKNNLWEFVFVTGSHLVVSPEDGRFIRLNSQTGATVANGTIPPRHHLFDVYSNSNDLLLVSRTNRNVDVRRVTKDQLEWKRSLRVSRIPLFGEALPSGFLIRLLDQQQQQDASLVLVGPNGELKWETKMPHALVEQPVLMDGNVAVLSADPIPGCV